jgi:ABC-type Fe3+-siderophore transport system permease subunit
MATFTLLGSAGFAFNGGTLLWISIHFIGLIAAWMVRMSTGRRYELLVQGSFFTSLLAVAMTTVVGHWCCLEMWPFSAVTLALMIVLAIVELGSSESHSISIES